MSKNVMITLVIFGLLTIIIIMVINNFTKVLSANPEPAWFMLGFGSCFLVEGIVWWALHIYQRYFS